jgi:hypothetical protein
MNQKSNSEDDGTVWNLGRVTGYTDWRVPRALQATAVIYSEINTSFKLFNYF